MLLPLTTGMLRILIVDDHEMVRELLRLAIGKQADLAIAGEAGDGQGAIDAAARHAPDVVLLDYRMPHTACFATLVGDILRASPASRIVVLSGFASPEIARAAATAGARGYVLKQNRLRGVFEAIRAVCAGGVWVDPTLPPKVFETFQRAAAQASGQHQGLALLTRREREVLGCVARGESNRDIAVRLCVSQQTVKTHLTRIFAKLEVRGRSAAASAYFSGDPSASAAPRTTPPAA